MSDGDEPNKPTLLKAEVPKHVAEQLDEMAKQMGFSTRAKLIRHIISQYMFPQATFQEYERMDPGHGGQGQTTRQDVDLSELEAILHTLNKSMDQNAAHLNIIARQNETIHRLVEQNETLQTQLTGNGPAALPEQTQTRPEVVEDRTEPGQSGTEMEQTPGETVPEPNHTEPPQDQDKPPLQAGDMLEVPQAVTMGEELGVKFSKDTIRRAVDQGILQAVPNAFPMKVATQDVRAFAMAWKTRGRLNKMPQIRAGKVIQPQ